MLLTAVVITLLLVFAAAGGGSTSRPGAANPTARFGGAGGAAAQFDADHATFASVNDLAGQSANIVIGTVRSSKPGESTPLGTDPATGAALPTLPHTDFAVRVDQVLKGSLLTGDEVTVTLAGGMTDVGPVTVDGVPDLPVASRLLFFLTAGNGNRYYPLAGGAAIAVPDQVGGYTLTGEVTGTDPLKFDQSQVLAAPHTMHLVVTAHPALELDGALQSGGVARAVEPAGWSLTGGALVDGSVVSLDIHVAGATATGSFSVDGTTFTLAEARSVGGPKDGAHITGSVTTHEAGKRYTTTMNLIVSSV